MGIRKKASFVFCSFSANFPRCRQMKVKAFLRARKKVYTYSIRLRKENPFLSFSFHQLSFSSSSSDDDSLSPFLLLCIMDSPPLFPSSNSTFHKQGEKKLTIRGKTAEVQKWRETPCCTFHMGKLSPSSTLLFFSGGEGREGSSFSVCLFAK